MKYLLTLILLVVSGCILPLHTRSNPYYLSKPIRGEDEITVDSDSISVYFDERALIWMDAVMLNSRQLLQEDAACLHIAKQIGDTAFYVDSLEISAKMPMPPGYGPDASWKGIRSMCPPESAPIHWHVVTPAWKAALEEGYWPADLIIQHRCELSTNDKQALLARYSFVAMQCGFGRDSVVVHKIKRR